MCLGLAMGYIEPKSEYAELKQRYFPEKSGGSVSLIDAHIDPDKNEITDKELEEQQAEIEGLKGAKKRELSDGCKSCQHNTVCYEIENLKCRNEFIWYQAESGCPHFQTDTKAEAIKEFAERLKNECAFECDVSLGYGRPCYEDAIPIIAIDNLVKEMVGEQGC